MNAKTIGLLCFISLAPLMVACGESLQPTEGPLATHLGLPPAWTEIPDAPAANTPSAASTPTETAELQNNIVFSGEPPSWLSDPAIDVLAVVIGIGFPCRDTGSYPLVFMNAETGQQFEVMIPPAGAMMWLDSSTFGLLSMDGQTILAIDLADGSVETTSFKAEGIRLLRRTESIEAGDFSCTMTPLNIARGGPSGEGAIVFISPRSSYSADLSLFAETSGAIEVRQVGTGALVWNSDPDDEFDDTNEYGFAWSSVNSTHLAVVECDYKRTDMCWPQRVFVVDVARGEELASYPGAFMFVAWPPDGRRIFYQQLEWQVIDKFSGPPCLLDLGTGENECFEEVPLTHFPEHLWITYKMVTELQWDRRGNGFSYIYQVAYYEPNDLGTPGVPLDNAGLCHFDLTTRVIDCPSEDPPELRGGWMSDYVLSHDERFAYVQASSETVVHGVLNMADGTFFRLPGPPGEDLSDASRSVSTLWRPLSPSANAAGRHP